MKYLFALPLLLLWLLNPTLTSEPETPAYTAARAELEYAYKQAKLKEAADLAAQRAVAKARLVAYLERKWRQPRSDIQQAVELSFLLAETTPKHWPQPLDVLAVIQVESGFNRQAHDPVSGSVGLMQVNADDHKLSPAELVKPRVSIAYGLKLLRKYRREMLSESQALAAYNQGPVSATATCGKRIACVTPYVLKIASAKQELQRHFN